MAVDDTMIKIVKLLKTCGDTYSANWAAQMLTQLLTASDHETRRKALTRILMAVTGGMGSLNDIYLIPPSGSDLTEAEANEQMRRLVEQLYGEVQTAL